MKSYAHLSFVILLYVCRPISKYDKNYGYHRESWGDPAQIVRLMSSCFRKMTSYALGKLSNKQPSFQAVLWSLKGNVSPDYYGRWVLSIESPWYVHSTIVHSSINVLNLKNSIPNCWVFFKVFDCFALKIVLSLFWWSIRWVCPSRFEICPNGFLNVARWASKVLRY